MIMSAYRDAAHEEAAIAASLSAPAIPWAKLFAINVAAGVTVWLIVNRVIRGAR